MGKPKDRVYLDFKDWWNNGKHGYSSAGRGYAKEIWKDLEPTIRSNRGDYEQLLILECEGYRKRFSNYFKWIQEFIATYKLEEVAGITFNRWILNKILEKDNATKNIDPPASDK